MLFTAALIQIDTMRYDGLYDHRSGGGCDKTTDNFYCYYIGPVLGITVAGAVIISIIVITICCYRRQKGAPGVVLSQENIYPEAVIEPYSLETCSVKVDPDEHCTNVSVVPPLYDSINYGYLGEEEMRVGNHHEPTFDTPPPYHI